LSQAQEPSDRRWTVEEANATLPWVGERLQRARERLEDVRHQASRAAAAVRSNGHGSLRPDLAPVKAILDEIVAAGIVVRDLERGLIDFPADTPSGRTYLLCWLLGEEQVAWWHWPEDGFAGRTPLDTPPE
jgi:hypothetical protein